MKKISILLFCFPFTTLIDPAFGQNPLLLDDINTTTITPAGYFDMPPCNAGNLMYFNASDNRGLGLWRTDGTKDGTVFLTSETFLDRGIAYQNEFFFSGKGGIWKSDGTAAGTILVSSAPAYSKEDVYIDDFTIANGLLFFTAETKDHGYELWETDGTEAGTKIVKEFQPGSSDSDPGNLIAYNNKLLFGANAPGYGFELFITDGTEAGTTLVKDIYPGTTGALPLFPVEYNGYVYFKANDKVDGMSLWRTDGTEAGTVMVKDFDSTNIDMTYGGRISVLNGEMITFSKTVNEGLEPWVSDGTTAGTHLLKDINPGNNGSPNGNSPDTFFIVNDVAYFAAFSGSFALWRSDGTFSGTYKVNDVKGIAPKKFAALPDGKFVFVLFTGSNDELWVSNGTDDGTYSINKQFYSKQNLANTNSFDGKVFFVADDNVLTGDKLCTTDGTADGTITFKFPAGETKSSSPGALVKANSNAYIFTAIDDAHGREYRSTDGVSGVTLLKDIIAGPTSSYTNVFSQSVNGEVYFTAADTISGNTYSGFHLWKTDGTIGGTLPVKSCWPVMNLGTAALNDIFYFINQIQNGSTYYYELWRTDGTENGTYLVKNINTTGDGNDNVTTLAKAGAYIYFVGSDGSHGKELWKSDGTAQGTEMVKDICPGFAGSDPGRFSSLNGKLYFSANDGANGFEPWISDGTSNGTFMLKNIAGASSSSYPENFTVSGNTLFFTATNAAVGDELWKTNGTNQGTILVKDIIPGKDGSSASYLTDVNGTLYFTALTEDCLALEKSDGTSSGTVIVKDFSDEDCAVVLDLRNVNGYLYFLANDDGNDQMLWRSDGTLCHTQPIDFFPGGDDHAGIKLVDSNVIFLSLNTSQYGTELWRYVTSPITSVETCNGFDDDCDGLIDEDAATVSITTDAPPVLCEGDPITMMASGAGITSYQWYKNGGPVPGATNNSFTTIYGKTYYVMVNASSDCPVASNTITVERKPRPQAAITVLNNGNLDLCLGAVELQSNSGNDLTWQWLLNGEPIAGATDQNYVPAVPGNYRVKVFKSNGCGSSSQKVVVTSSCRTEPVFTDESTLVIYPNPASEFITVDLRLSELISCKSTIIITDVLGRTVLNENAAIVNGAINHLIPLEQSIANGVYMLHLVCTDYSFQKQFVVQR